MICPVVFCQVRAAQQLSQDPNATNAVLQNPLFAQMGQMLMNNPAAMQQMQQLMSGANPTSSGSGQAVQLPPPSASESGAATTTEEEDRMLAEAMRQSMLELDSSRKQAKE
jgi:hypothetical protein|eukprot:COSAG01_NODE_2615_length_7380_cov_4.124159_3_plen_111_part_00